MDKPSALPPAPAPPGPGAELGAEPGAGGGGGHDHGPVRYRHPELRARARRNLLLALGLTAAVFLAEVAGGILSGSLALISDAGHMLADSMALGISLAALYLSARGADEEKTFGWYRVEILAALANGAALAVLAAFILREAAGRLFDPRPVLVGIMLPVAAGGLLANIAGILFLSRARDNLNVRGALLHVLGDAVSSVGVVAGGVVIALTGWHPLDTLLSLAIVAFILVSAFLLLREAVNVLLEAAPRGIAVEEVRRVLEGLAGVAEVHDLHVWAITSGINAMSGHVCFRAGADFDLNAALNLVKRALYERFRLVHTTIQVEREGYAEIGKVCR